MHFNLNKTATGNKGRYRQEERLKARGEAADIYEKPFRQGSEGSRKLFPFSFKKPFRLSPQSQDPSGVTSAAGTLHRITSNPVARVCQRLYVALLYILWLSVGYGAKRRA
jgi:hypothetical protein